MKITDKLIDNEIGKELHSHRGNMCELPNGSIKYNYTIIVSFLMTYNF